MTSVYLALDRPLLSLEYAERSLTIAREDGLWDVVGVAVHAMGQAYAKLDQPSHAIALYEQSLDIACRVGDRDGETRNCWELGLLYESQGDLARAVESMQARIDYERDIRHPAAKESAARVDEIRRRLEDDSSRA